MLTGLSQGYLRSSETVTTRYMRTSTHLTSKNVHFGISTLFLVRRDVALLVGNPHTTGRETFMFLSYQILVVS